MYKDEAPGAFPTELRILALPRDRNPYQRLLYGEMRRLGAHVIYVGELTPSRILNLILLPVEMVVRRLAGARVIHLHWVFVFSFPGAQRWPFLRELAHFWFRLWLRSCRIAGVRLIWTAHNVLPHEQVFLDDVSARRDLVRKCDLVLAHSGATLQELAELGAIPNRSAVIPHGPIPSSLATADWHVPGTRSGPRRFLYFGNIHDYKGVDDLLVAFSALPKEVSAHLTVVGQCDDARLRSDLLALAEVVGARVVMRLERAPEDEVSQLLTTADMVVLPFRRVTTSGSAMLALSHGRPLIVPDLPALGILPDEAVLKYGLGIPDLTRALTRAARMEEEVLAAMSTAAHQYAFATTWDDIAEKTVTEIVSVLHPELPCASALPPTVARN